MRICFCFHQWWRACDVSQRDCVPHTPGARDFCVFVPVSDDATEMKQIRIKLYWGKTFVNALAFSFDTSKLYISLHRYEILSLYHQSNSLIFLLPKYNTLNRVKCGRKVKHISHLILPRIIFVTFCLRRLYLTLVCLYLALYVVGKLPTFTIINSLSFSTNMGDMQANTTSISCCTKPLKFL